MSSLHQTSPGPSPTTSVHAGLEERRESQDASFQSSMSDPDSSALSFETSFHMESGYPVPRPENERHPKGKRKRTTYVPGFSGRVPITASGAAFD